MMFFFFGKNVYVNSGCIITSIIVFYEQEAFVMNIIMRGGHFCHFTFYLIVVDFNRPQITIQLLSFVILEIK